MAQISHIGPRGAHLTTLPLYSRVSCRRGNQTCLNQVLAVSSRNHQFWISHKRSCPLQALIYSMFQHVQNLDGPQLLHTDLARPQDLLRSMVVSWHRHQVHSLCPASGKCHLVVGVLVRRFLATDRSLMEAP